MRELVLSYVCISLFSGVKPRTKERKEILRFPIFIVAGVSVWLRSLWIEPNSSKSVIGIEVALSRYCDNIFSIILHNHPLPCEDG